MNKNIKKIFNKIMHNHFEVDKERNVYTVDIFPEVVTSEKYFDFRDEIIMTNKYNILNKYIIALCKIFMYDKNVYILDKNKENDILKLDEVGALYEFEKYITESIIAQSPMPLLLDDLKIGFLLGDGYVTYTDLGNGKINLVTDIFEKEGLYIEKG